MPNPKTPTSLAQHQRPEGAALSPDRAFVVHFYETPSGEQSEAGRAEHIRSGQTTHFGSWRELATFIAKALHGSTASARMAPRGSR